MKQFLKLILLALISLNFTNCGKLGTQRYFGKNLMKGTAGLEEPLQHTFKLSELTIAKRVCSALVNKKTVLKSALTGSPNQKVTYTFNVERKKNCGDSKLDKSNLSAQIALISNDLEFSSSETSILFTDVITDKSPALSSICSEILNTQTTIDQKTISNATVLSDRLYLVAFSTSNDGLDTVQINTKKFNNKSGGYDPQDSQLVSIITTIAQDTSNDVRNIGVEKERTQYIPCAGKQFTSLKETFVRSFFAL
jgi:hypothetical protein